MHIIQSKSIRTMVLVALALGLAACAGTGNQSFVASPDEEHGLIVTHIERPGDFLYSVKIKSVDGQEIPARQQGIWLTPGQHSIDAIDATPTSRSFVPGLRGDRSKANDQKLQLFVEAGKVYYVGLQATGSRRSDWNLVVWKVEDQKT